jgi:hypothetical protein
VKKTAAFALVLLALAGCSQTDDEPQAGSSGTVAVESPTIRPSAPPTQTPTTAPVSPTAPKPTTPQPAATSNGPGETTFCDYLEQTAGAQQQVEDPAQFVKLVKGAQAVAPGAIADDLALYAQSVQKLADTVTADAQTAAKADRWLARNEAAITQAEANLNSYSESTCGRPFITGEG